MHLHLPKFVLKNLLWGSFCGVLTLGHAQNNPFPYFPVAVTNPNEMVDVVAGNGQLPIAGNNGMEALQAPATSFDAIYNRFAFRNLPYPIVPAAGIVLPIKSVQVLDERPQKKWSGFVPVGLEQKKKGVGMEGMDLGKGVIPLLSEWMGQHFLQADTLTTRRAVFVLREFWFSQNATTHRHSPNGGFETTLHYAVDAYSLQQDQFYPQFQCVGEKTQPFAEGQGYENLMDDFLQTLRQKLVAQNWERPETPSQAIAPKVFLAHYQEKRDSWQKALGRKVGLYASYADFLAQKPLTDSVKVLQRFTLNQQRPLYALTLQAKAGEEEKNVYGTWGYCDGESLFYHLGNGLFIKLIQWENSFVFPHLNLFLRDNVKAKTLLGIRLGQSDYALIKEYSRINPLTYQLNLVTGELY